MPSYDKPQANEWVQPVRRGYRMMCCDCGSRSRDGFPSDQTAYPVPRPAQQPRNRRCSSAHLKGVDIVTIPIDDGLRAALYRGFDRWHDAMDAPDRGHIIDYMETELRVWAVGELEARTTTLRDENEKMRAELETIACSLDGHDMTNTAMVIRNFVAALGSGDPERTARDE